MHTNPLTWVDCPAPSHTFVIPLHRFQKKLPIADRIRLMTFHDIDSSIRTALDTVGHTEASYYSVPHGFAIVTKLEGIENDGSTKPEETRWDADSINVGRLSLSAYIRSLFGAPVGKYRLIVFVVTPEQFSGGAAKISRKVAEDWLVFGTNMLPPVLGSTSITRHTVCTALIYEFKKQPNKNEPLFMRPGTISITDHFKKLGLEYLLP